MTFSAKCNQILSAVVLLIFVSVMHLQAVCISRAAMANGASVPVSLSNLLGNPIRELNRVPSRNSSLPFEVIRLLPELSGRGTPSATKHSRHNNGWSAPDKFSACHARDLEALQDRPADRRMRNPVGVLAAPAAERSRVLEQLGRFSIERFPTLEARSLSHVLLYSSGV
jgi:hypothetical protein